MATFVVTTSADMANGDVSETDLSLREAIELANVNAGPDRIRFANGIDLITLQDALPSVTESLAIRGRGSVTIDANAQPAQPRRALDFDGAERVVIDGLVITGGRVSSEDGGGVRARDVGALKLRNSTLDNNVAESGYSGGNGGGISVSSTDASLNTSVTISDCNVTNNAAYFGGGISVLNAAELRIVGSKIVGNDSSVGGGGVVAGAKDHFVIVDCEISGNSAYGGGGGISSAGDVTLYRSRVDDNSAGHGSGGGIFAAGDVTLVGSLIRNNHAPEVNYNAFNGGGVAAFGNVWLLDTIVAGNSSSYGGGIWASGSVRAEGSEISGNSALGSYPYGAEGGGVSASKFVAVNSTISGNYVGYSTGGVVSGGGISADDVTLRNSTVTGNVVLSNSGGGVSADTIRVRNSLVVGNAALYGPDDVRGTIRSDRLSLVGGDGREVFAETTRIAPGIFAGILGENGGLTRTVALRFDRDNPAIGGADPETATPTDQRGVARDARPDLGAFEATRQRGVTIVGGERSDVLRGTNDPDRLAGAGGGDTIIALAASDLLFGGDGDDILQGGRGADGLRGGSGADRLTGGRNDDVLGGGADSDRFVFRREFGSDSILDFDADPGGGQDRMSLRPLGISAADFDTQVTITDLGPRTLVEIAGQGTILCAGVSGRGENRIDVEDFLFAP